MSKSFVQSLAIAAVVVCLGAGVRARQGGNAEAAKLRNPVASTPESIAAGKKVYEASCAACHGMKGEGAEKAGIVVSYIEDAGGRQPSDLSDAAWDHGSTDGEIFSVIRDGVPPQFFMGPWKDRISDTDIWNVVNYLRSLATK